MGIRFFPWCGVTEEVPRNFGLFYPLRHNAACPFQGLAEIFQVTPETGTLARLAAGNERDNVIMAWLGL